MTIVYDFETVVKKITNTKYEQLTIKFIIDT